LPVAICTEWGPGASHPVDGEDAPHLAWHIWGAFFMCQGDPYRSPVHNGFSGGHTVDPWHLLANKAADNPGKWRRA
jgi:hypothetical protein